MKFRATRLSAVVAGLWCAIGGAATEDVTASRSPVGLLITVTVFFLVPALFLVVGTEYIRRWKSSVTHPFRRRPRDHQYWTETTAAMTRVLYWFVTAVISVLAYTVVRRGGWPVR
jgi:hypothetical protein